MKVKQLLVLAGTGLLLASFGCKKTQQSMTVANEESNSTAEKIYNDPVPGGSGSIVPSTETTLSYTGTNFTNSSLNLGGALAGSQMLVSNVPEQVSSRGWVFRGSINDGNLGSLRGITGSFVFYLYHYLFGSVGTNTKGYLVARNVSSVTVSVTGRGYYEVKQNAGDNSTSLRTARHWLADKRSGTTQSGFTGPSGNIQRLRTVSQSIPANGYAILDEVAAPNSQTIDARYELSASSNVVIYYVYDNLDALSASAKLTQLATIVGSNTGRARGVWIDPVNPSTGTSPGYIVETGNPAPNAPTGLTVPTVNGRFGRECGIYNNSDWVGTTNITLPSGIATLRLHYNTSAKSGGQEQCADAGIVGAFRTTTPVDSTAFQGNDYNIFKANGGRPTNALRSYGNYGHYYQLTFNISNTSGRARRVQLLVGRSGTGRYYAPFWVRSAGFTSGNVDVLNDIILDPGVAGGSGTEKVLADVTIANGAPGANIRVNAVVPGSITIGQFFLVRTLD